MPSRKQAAQAVSRAHLSRQQVIRTALALVDSGGLDQFSMRKLGTALGVDPMAVYYYFPDKAAILDGLTEAIMEEVVFVPQPGLPWQEQLRELSRAYRQVLRAHPHALPVVATRPISSTIGFRLMEQGAVILREAGLPAQKRWDILLCLAYFIIGHALADVGRSPGSVPDPPLEKRFAQLMDFPEEEFPALRETRPEDFLHEHDIRFELGIDLLLRGLTAYQHSAQTEGDPQ